MGGREAIEKLDARACYGEVTTDLESVNEPVHEKHAFEIYSRLPDLCVTVMRRESDVEWTGYDGVTGWCKKENKVTEDTTAGKSRLAWLANPHNALVVQSYFSNLTFFPISHTTELKTGMGRQYMFWFPSG
jgi:hypothetical protein